jgi:hypothetical protein
MTLVGGVDFVTAEGFVVVEPAVDFDVSLVGGFDFVPAEGFVVVEPAVDFDVSLVGGFDFVPAEGFVVVEPAVNFDVSLVGGVGFVPAEGFVVVESTVDFDDFVLVEGVTSNLVTLVEEVGLLVAEDGEFRLLSVADNSFERGYVASSIIAPPHIGSIP